MDLVEDLVGVIHVVECDHRGDSVERFVGERNRLRLALEELDVRPTSTTEQDLFWICLEDDNFPATGREALRRCAGAASQVEEMEGGSRADLIAKRVEVRAPFANAQPLGEPDANRHRFR